MGPDRRLHFDLCTDTTPLLLGVCVQGKSLIETQSKRISSSALAPIHVVRRTDVTAGTKAAVVPLALELSGGTS